MADQTKSALYILYNEDAAAHNVYKLGCTDNLARRKFDSSYVTASRRPWTYWGIFELRPDRTRLWQNRPLDALAVETLVKRELQPHRATPLTAYFGSELFQLSPEEIASTVEKYIKQLELVYVRRDFQAHIDENGHRVYEDGFPTPRYLVVTETEDPQLQLTPNEPAPERPRPRSYQREILDNAYEKLQQIDRGRILMACGTGKTLTMYWLSLQLKAETVALIVPRLDLGAQTLESWQQQYKLEGLPLPHLCILASKNLTPKGWPSLTTTNTSDLKNWLKHHTGPRLIVATYDSSPTLAGTELDLLLLDEAHHTAPHESDDSEYRRNLLLLDNATLPTKWRVSFTATNKKTMTESTHGPILGRYGFERGIEDKHLTDYQIVVLTSSPNSSLGGDTFEAEAVIRSLRDYPIRRLLVFCSNRAEGRLLAHRLRKHYEKGDNQPYIAYLDSSVALKTRRETLKEFESTVGQAILVNVRLFIEGADMPSLDGVALCCSKTSTCDLTQIVGRALRPSLGKTGAYIVVPAVVSENLKNNLTEAKKQAGFYRVFKLLRVLSKLDTDVHAAALSGKLHQARAVRFLPRSGEVPDIELSQHLSTMVTTHLREKIAPIRREPKYVPVPPTLEKYGLLLRVNQQMYRYEKAFRALPVIEWKVPGLVVPSNTPVAIIGNSPLGILAFGRTDGASYQGEFSDDGYWTEFGVRESLQNTNRQRDFVKVRLTHYARGPVGLRGSITEDENHPIIRDSRKELVTRKQMATDETVEVDVSASQDGSELFRADSGATFMARKINCRRAIATWLDKGAFLRLEFLCGGKK